MFSTLTAFTSTRKCHLRFLWNQFTYDDIVRFRQRKIRILRRSHQMIYVILCYLCLLRKVTTYNNKRFHRGFWSACLALLHQSQPLAVAEYGHCGVEGVEAAVEGYALVEAKDAV